MNETISFKNHPAIKSVLSSLDEKTRRYMRKVIDETEKALGTVTRWAEGIITNIDGIDTNREHVLGMLDLAWKYKDIFEKICDFEDLIIAILVHDLGEFGNGDISQTHPDAEKMKKETKENERKTALELIGKISDENLRKRAKSIMNRYMDFSLQGATKSWDTLILVTKLLDFVQGFDYGVDEVFMANIESDEKKKEYILEHIMLGLKKIIGLLKLLEFNIIKKTGKKDKALLNSITNGRTLQPDGTEIKTRGVYDLWDSEILPSIKRKVFKKYGVRLNLNFQTINEGIMIIAKKFGVPNGLTPELIFLITLFDIQMGELENTKK